MKIISGTLKGRKIDGFDIAGTRPTMDRVKESLFSMINPYLDNAICLDLFAGSGNLGFEAISNGASFCYFNDKNPKCTASIKKNTTSFKINSSVKILNLDYQKCLEYLKDDGISLDIVFLDPPYRDECLNEVIDFLLENDLLKDNAIVVCEVDNNYLREEVHGLEMIKSRQYGDKFIIIYKKTSL